MTQQEENRNFVINNRGAHLALVQDLCEMGLFTLTEHVDLPELLCWPLQDARHMVHPELSSQQALQRNIPTSFSKGTALPARKQRMQAL